MGVPSDDKHVYVFIPCPMLSIVYSLVDNAFVSITHHKNRVCVHTLLVSLMLVCDVPVRTATASTCTSTTAVLRLSVLSFHLPSTITTV